MKRKIISIDERKCTGCGLCIPDCPEGALQLIEGKARLVSDLFCDGLGACMGSCPEGAIAIEEREAQPYDETRVMANVARQGRGVIRAHLAHLHEHGQDEYLREALAYLIENDIEAPAEFLASKCRCDEIAPAPAGPAGGCPGSRARNLDRPVPGGGKIPEVGADGAGDCCAAGEPAAAPGRPSQLKQWPVQIMLVPTEAPFFKDADLLFAADCVPFACPEFHEKLLRGRVCLVGCPKLDDARHYREKISEIFRRNDIRSATIAYMEVPCCSGLVSLVESALAAAGKRIPLSKHRISISGAEV